MSLEMDTCLYLDILEFDKYILFFTLKMKVLDNHCLENSNFRPHGILQSRGSSSNKRFTDKRQIFCLHRHNEYN